MITTLTVGIITGPHTGKSGVVVTPLTKSGKLKNGSDSSVGVFDRLAKQTYYVKRSEVVVLNSLKNTEAVLTKWRKTYSRALKQAVEASIKSGRSANPFGAATRKEALTSALADSEPSVVAAAYRAYAEFYGSNFVGGGKASAGKKLPEKTPLQEFGHRLMQAAGHESRVLRRQYKTNDEPVETTATKPELKVFSASSLETEPEPVITSWSPVEIVCGRIALACVASQERNHDLYLQANDILAHLMGVDPADIWKAVSSLAASGYKLRATSSGDWLVTPPPPPAPAKSDFQLAQEKLANLSDEASLEDKLSAIRAFLNATVAAEG